MKSIYKSGKLAYQVKNYEAGKQAFQRASKAFELSAHLEPNREESKDDLSRAAVSYTYLCNFEKSAQLLKNSNMEENTAGYYYNLGTYLHYLNYNTSLDEKYDNAIKNYEKVISDYSDQEGFVEKSLFNLGVIYYHIFKNSKSRNDIEKSIDYLKRSISMGGDERMKIIQDSTQHPSEPCSEYYATNDLAGIEEHKIFKALLKK